MKQLIMLLSVAACLCTTACKQKEDIKEAALTFTATSPIVIDTNIVKKYVSQIRSIRHIEIRSQEKGYLEKVFVDEGQYVHKGQLLFQIMPTLYNAEFSKAKAEVEAANIELENTKLLYDKKVVAPNELAVAKAKLSKARAEMELANTHLKFTRIVAPYSGYINHLELKLGSLVDEGDLISTLSDNSQIWVYFNVPEAEYLDFKENDSTHNLSKVELLMANNKVFKNAGKVETIEADFNNETGNIAFRATFPNPENLLRNGETGNILMSVPFHQAVIIPQKATFEIMDKKYVYTINDKNVVKLTPISIKAEMPDLFVIDKGLKGTEKIVLDGIRRVQDGHQIKFSFIDPRKVMSELQLESE